MEYVFNGRYRRSGRAPVEPEVASQRAVGQKGEDRKVDLTVSETEI